MSRENYEIIENGRIGERYFRFVHGSGITALVLPKKFSTCFAMFGTKYGSIDRCFIPSGKSSPITVPDGIAHFLEHKMFEQPDGRDAFELFAEVGADANAFTSFDRTAYLFSATEKYDEALRTLLTFVSQPYYTDASVQKEQGIIAQEIRMGEDDPRSAVFYRMTESMYKNNPVRVNIAGTVESIAEITPEVLYDCYKTFYTPKNMVLCVCGDITPETVEAALDSVYPPDGEYAGAPVRVFPEEPREVCEKRTFKKMQVARSLFHIGVKHAVIPSDPAEMLRQTVAEDILNEILFGEASDFYNGLHEKGLLSPKFGTFSESCRYYSLNCLSGSSDDPEAVFSEFMKTVENAAKNGIGIEDFERCRKVILARCIRRFDSTEEIASTLLDCELDGCGLFDDYETAARITPEDVADALEDYREDRVCMSVIAPLDR